jgi:hypothetical protein
MPWLNPFGQLLKHNREVKNKNFQDASTKFISKGERMKLAKSKHGAALAAILAIIVISPLDDVILAALFGTALFGFGSTAFYLLLIASSAVSITLWKKHGALTRLRCFGRVLLQKYVNRKKTTAYTKSKMKTQEFTIYKKN